MADIKADPGLLNIKDNVFGLKTCSFIQQEPGYYFFNCIEVSVSEIGEGGGGKGQIARKQITGNDTISIGPKFRDME